MAKTRTVGVAVDFSPTSKSALKWALHNLTDKGDRLILINVQPSHSDHTRKDLFHDTGSPLVPLEELRETNLVKQYGIPRDPEVMAILDTGSKTRGAKVEAKVYWGDPKEKLCKAVNQLQLDSLVVGSRGFGPIKRVLLGSVSNHVVRNASCPVTVIKGSPSAKCSR
ncbi:universal stress protein PHOS32 [Neltuma alba]|uniref:universal stress protein PHOS32-like n=1 Tax=Neltuma alba TaxID=207710 RepID=UPI0010A53512|nr:universal stress protein PHOS32-like [Prosopis alba]XP_028800534.1 universal stress protein PHOS32-like [Prosopis alba]XP_028800580.1 universal stress protein PHOS32 [Prosopis alba]